MNPLETYLRELRDIHSTGAAVPETSYYGCLERLLNEIGKTLKPKVRCVINLANRGAGIPDGGLFTPDQIKKDDPDPMQAQAPSRGVMEVKSTADDVADIADSEQVARYCKKFGLVLVTNYRDFTLVARDGSNKPILLEAYQLAGSEEDFWAQAAHPRALADKHGERFAGYLMRAMQHNAPLSDPKDLAWFLASYARDALARVKGSNLPALASLRKALEDSLGMKFTGERGEHFFESTLIQTLFYGVFSAWVLWSKEHPPTDKTQFDWMHSPSYLRVPVLRKLFYQAADPGQLDALNLSEVLNWATTALNRVDRAAFFEKFQQHHAVQYFYEPFLEAYDPELRKQLGVWYTPPEIVQYMVKRVDRVLREELSIEDGLADPRVYVLDPCCGTGAFLVGVLDQIAATLRDKGGDALVSHDLKTAVQERVFGFEILPAPYVVSHLQLGLRLADLQVPLTGKQRVGVYLTNALTGWEPPKEPQATLPFVEFQEEHDAADSVKQSTPILVILGNPPYNGFSDIAVDEERDLSTAYRETKKAPKPQGQGLNDLYVRFFRMAERRIVDKTGQGIVCFISNYSWLDGLSHTGMRERYIEAFDKIWIDNLHGDRIISEYAPDGRTSETVFAIQGQSPGIKIGTSISLLAKTGGGEPAEIYYRDFEHARADDRRQALVASTEEQDQKQYSILAPVPEIGFPFKPRVIGVSYLNWPLLPDLLPVSFAGIKTSRDEVTVAIDKDKLSDQMRQYCDRDITDEDAAKLMPRLLKSTPYFDANAARQSAKAVGFRPESIIPYLFRPFDLQWTYWDRGVRIMDRPRPEYMAHVRPGNIWLTAAQRSRKQPLYTPAIAACAVDLHLFESNVSLFPLVLYGDGTEQLFERVNLSRGAQDYLQSLKHEVTRESAQQLFYHILAVLHAPTYTTENAGALRQDWPRIPLPATREVLEASPALGRQIAALLDVQQPVRGVTTGKINPELKTIGLITHVEGKQINDADDLAVTAGWGNPGRGGICMPAGGKAIQRDFTPEERTALATAGTQAAALGQATFDIYLNANVYWKNIPQAVWEYTLGGYQVIKKWLSYREHKLLARPLRADEARYVTEMSRRIAAILLMHAALDENYRRVAASTYDRLLANP